VVTDAEWDKYSRDGYLPLGPVVSMARLEALRHRVDDLALGKVSNPHVRLQLDTGGAYDELPAAVERFDHGTSSYRKVQGLETDDLYSGLLRHPAFVEVCARQYGPHVPISVFRAMVMNKPAGQGTELPWHQDGGAVWELDRDPLVTIWVALDPATPENGCMEIVPGSHRLGMLTWFGSTISDRAAALHCTPGASVPLPVDEGHAVLLHNWLLHRSGVNPTLGPRRAFTCCYLDGRTRSNLTGDVFPLVWGELPVGLPLHLEQLRNDNAKLLESRASAEEYARSLLRENEILHASIAEATTYARSLEAEIARLQEHLHPG
jgi:Phytanoyl-CoA dioxygenase (PhyH)